MICCASTSRAFSGIVQPVQLAAPHRVEQRRALHQFVARQREQSALGDAADRMPGAAHALQEGVDGARRADLAHQVHIADVDAELERGGRHQHLQLAALQALLGVQAPLLGQAAVMRGDILLAEPLGQMPRHALGQAARVDEHQRGAMLADQLAPADRRPASTPRPTSPPRAAPAATSSARSRRRAWPLSTMVQRPAPARSRRSGTSPPPRSASASPTIRRASVRCRSSACSRSSDSARCAPRLLPAMA